MKEILSSFSQEKCPSAKQQNKTTKARAKQRRQYPSSFCTTNNCSKKTPAKSIIFVWRKATFFIFYLNDFLSPPVLSLSAEPFPALHSPGYLLMIECQIFLKAQKFAKPNFSNIPQTVSKEIYKQAFIYLLLVQLLSEHDQPITHYPVSITHVLR